MGETAKTWCGLVVGEQNIEICLLCDTREKQVRRFPNEPGQYQGILQWLASESCTHIALSPAHASWKQLRGLLQKRFTIIVVEEQMVRGSASPETCCHWLASLLRSGRLDKMDQVEPIGDRSPHSDEDALGGQPGKGPEHSGQAKK